MSLVEPEPRIDEAQVLAYLASHPEFLKKHPELLEVLTPPEQKMGRNVLDFQRFAMGSLQQNVQELKDKFNGLLGSARDNMSVQSQVHQAVLQILKARDLEQLLETLTIDLARFFDVDVVRIALESDIAELYEATYGEHSYSGLCFLPLDRVDLALGTGRQTLLISDTQNDPPYGYDEIFAECANLVQSCALLRIYLDKIDRLGILAFGVRDVGRFHSHQGVELLHFLSEVVALRLNQCLNASEIENLL